MPLQHPGCAWCGTYVGASVRLENGTPVVDEFAHFYAACYARVYAQLHAYIGDRHEAQNLTHEAFCRAFDRWAGSAAMRIRRRGCATSPGTLPPTACATCGREKPIVP